MMISDVQIRRRRDDNALLMFLLLFFMLFQKICARHTNICILVIILEWISALPFFARSHRNALVLK